MSKEWSCNFVRTREYDIDTPPGEEDRYIYTTSKAENGVEEGISRTQSRLRTDLYSLVGQAHTHPVETHPIPSWLDLRGLKNVYKYAYDYNKNDVFIMIVCHTGDVYALKVDNFALLNQKIESDSTKAKGANKDIKFHNIEKELEEYYSDNANDLEKAFFKRYGNYGVSVYKATDNNLTNWERLELNKNKVDKVPCN